MKINVEFNLPDDKWDYKCFDSSVNMASTILDLDRFLRGIVKHGNEDGYLSPKIKTPRDLAEFIRLNYIGDLANDLNKE